MSKTSDCFIVIGETEKTETVTLSISKNVNQMSFTMLMPIFPYQKYCRMKFLLLSKYIDTHTQHCYHQQLLSQQVNTHQKTL